MVYRTKHVTTEALTYPTRSSCKETRWKLPHGIITKVEVEFPPGPHGVVHGTIWRGGHQVWPSDPEEDFASDFFTISFPERYPMIHEPFEFTLKTWNTSTLYPHLIIFRLLILPAEIIAPELVIKAIPKEIEIEEVTI